jgi:hypothetical protein
MQKKQTIGIICGVAVLLLLVGGVVLLTRPVEEESSSETVEDTTSAEDQVSLVLSEQETDDVTKITVTNDTGSYVVVRTQEAVAATDDEEEQSATFGVEGWEDLPTNTSLIRTLANNVADLEAEQCVEAHTDDLDKFGLGDSAICAEMQFEDGTTFSFRIGDSVSSSSSNYFAIEGSDTVYTVKTSLVANYSKSATDFLSTTIQESLDDDDDDDDTDTPTIQTVTITREDLEQPIVLTYQSDANDENSGGAASDYVMTSPISAYLSVERSDSVINDLFGLTASEILEVHPDDAAKEAAGITEPFATLTLACDDKSTYTLYIGAAVTETDEDGTSDTYYPVMLEGNDILYAVASDSCPWATITPTGLASKLIFTTYVWDVNQLDVTVGSESVSFVNSGTDAETAAITRDGEEVDTERYRLFYSFLLQTAAEEVVLGDTPTGTPDAEIHYSTYDGKEDRTVSFYRIDDFTCYIAVDGVLSFECRPSYLDALQNNLEIFDTDEDFQTTWQ